MEKVIPDLIYLGVLMAGGFAAGDLLERFGIPRVAGYVAAGALLSESLFGARIPGEPGVWSDALTSLALVVIAFMVGAEIDVGRLRRAGRTVAAVTLGQAAGAVAIVSAVLWGLSLFFSDAVGPGINFSTALVFGVIATATAPAAVLAVVEEYEAEGSLTSMLLGIVAIDDAVGIVLFTVAIGLIGDAAIVEQLASAGSEVLLSLAAGTIFGAALGLFGRHVSPGDLRLPIILGAVILNFGLAERFGYSYLLSSMALGFVAMISFDRSQREWLEPLEHARDTIFLLFFTLSGTYFDPGVFVSAFPLILAYIVARVLGKYFGTSASARLVGADENVQRYLGLALLPQAGVAIGLALHASSMHEFREIGSVLLNTMIGSTLVFALSAPWLTKLALRRAGEIERSTSE